MRMTLQQMWNSARQLKDVHGRIVGSWRRTYSQSPARKITQVIPFMGTNSVMVTGEFTGLTQNGVHHAATILVMGCEIMEEVPKQDYEEEANDLGYDPQNKYASDGTDYEASKRIELKKGYTSSGKWGDDTMNSATHFWVNYNGIIYRIRKLDLDVQTCLVRCSCNDYIYVWGFANNLRGVQFGGRIRPYVRKTPPYPMGLPPKNKYNIIGICKHLAGMAEMIKENQLGNATTQFMR